MRRTGLPCSNPAALLATWFGSGLLPWAPGSWGSLAALPFAWIIVSYTGALGLLIAAAAVFAAGCWAAGRVERRTAGSCGLIPAGLRTGRIGGVHSGKARAEIG